MSKRIHSEGETKYNEEDVLKQLERKHDLRIYGKQIRELKREPGIGGTTAKGDVGIKTRGKIDFLTNYRGYTHIYVSDFDEGKTWKK
jgi:hypothetical protein